LQRLTGMEQQKILDELADIQRRIAEYLESWAPTKCCAI
jgi:DNA gyrase subunit A